MPPQPRQLLQPAPPLPQSGSCSERPARRRPFEAPWRFPPGRRSGPGQPSPTARAAAAATRSGRHHPLLPQPRLARAQALPAAERRAGSRRGSAAATLGPARATRTAETSSWARTATQLGARCPKTRGRRRDQGQPAGRSRTPRRFCSTSRCARPRKCSRAWPSASTATPRSPRATDPWSECTRRSQHQTRRSTLGSSWKRWCRSPARAARRGRTLHAP
mmetsp:Transcript_19886/g.76247  ORF Transcript_19886/g.76247 Transcript_19886/m.76247 type:complete len:219 (-) Transcript_19886:271-927(-)